MDLTVYISIASVIISVIAIITAWRAKVDLKKSPPCRHSWVTVNERQIVTRVRTTGHSIQQKCKHCGDLKFHKITVWD